MEKSNRALIKLDHNFYTLSVRHKGAFRAILFDETNKIVITLYTEDYNFNNSLEIKIRKGKISLEEVQSYLNAESVYLNTIALMKDVYPIIYSAKFDFIKSDIGKLIPTFSKFFQEETLTDLVNKFFPYEIETGALDGEVN